MKNSKWALVGAAIPIASEVVSTVVDLLCRGVYMAPGSWSSKMVMIIWSVLIIRNSEVKGKARYIAAGVALYVAVGLVLSTLYAFGLVEMPY